jgi:hypothetical protein
MYRPMILQRAAVRLVLSLGVGAGVFYVADYLVTNTPAATAERDARENAAVVAIAREIYRPNGWEGMTNPDDDADDEIVAAASSAAGTGRFGSVLAAAATSHEQCLPGTCFDPPGADEPFGPTQ